MSRQSRPERHAARAALAGAGVLITLAVTGCAGGQIAGNTQQSSGQGFVGSSYVSTYYRAGNRLDAPAVTGVTLTGQKLTLAAFRGSVLVLNFWGSWCAPCRAEAPALGTLARQLAASGVRFMGIDIRDEPQAALAFMQTFRVGYPSLNDPTDGIALQFQNTVPPAAIPTTLVIDRTGKIAARIVGGATYAQLKSVVSAVVGQHA